MKPGGAELRRCAAPLPATVRNARGEWRRRESVLLRVYDADGRIGQGEASPLPGYSPDTVEACAAALWSVPWAELPAIESPQEATEVARRIDARLPAARFALETALLDLLGQAKERSLPRLLGVPPDRPVPLCALLQSETIAEQEAEVRELLRRGISCFKRKLLGTNSAGRRKDLYPERRGGSPDRVAMALLAALRQEAPTSDIRIDANGALLASEVGGTLRALAGIAPEWLEEPTSAWEALETSPVPLAFDETLQNPGTWDRAFDLLHKHGRGAVVLKPMALGGFGPCLDLAKRAHAAGLKAAVSHLFDGPVALAAAAALALALPAPHAAAGLTPHAGLAAWRDVPLHFLRGGSVIPWDAPGLGLSEVEPA